MDDEHESFSEIHTFNPLPIFATVGSSVVAAHEVVAVRPVEDPNYPGENAAVLLNAGHVVFTSWDVATVVQSITNAITNADA